MNCRTRGGFFRTVRPLLLQPRGAECDRRSETGVLDRDVVVSRDWFAERERNREGVVVTTVIAMVDFSKARDPDPDHLGLKRLGDVVSTLSQMRPGKTRRDSTCAGTMSGNCATGKSARKPARRPA